jgi:hypothetical protein
MKSEKAYLLGVIVQSDVIEKLFADDPKLMPGRQPLVSDS